MIENKKRLSELIGRGDIKSFEQLYDKYSSALLAFSYSFIGDKSIVEDVVQDSFMSLWMQRDSLPEEVDIQKYLFAIVRNKSISELRRIIRIHKESIEELSPKDYFLQRKLSSLEEMDSSLFDIENLKQIIDKTFNDLSPIYQDVFRMSRYENMNNAAIADKLNISVKAVEKRMTKVLKLLKNRLQDSYTIINIFLG